MDFVSMADFPYKIGTGVGKKARLGVVVLQSDETLEYDLRRLLPENRVALYTTRIASAAEVSTASLAGMQGALSQSASLLPPETALDVVGYGCTSGTAVIGAENIASLIKTGCRTSHATEPLSALIAACQASKIGKLAFLSPYVASVSAQLRTRLGDAGIQTPQFGSFNEASETKVAHIAPESVLEAAVSLYQRGGCEAIFLSCTNLQTLDVLAEIEARCGCRVFSSNLVLAWHMLTLAGLAPRDKNIASLLHA